MKRIPFDICRLTTPLLASLLLAITPVARSQTPIANPLALSGTWYNPATRGQGFVFDIAPNSDGSATVFGGWFTYSTPDISVSYSATSQLWFTLQGSFHLGQAAITTPIYYNGGGNFDAPPITKAINVGSATLRLGDCTHMMLDYSFSNTPVVFPAFHPNETGTIPLVRLTADTGCGSAAALPKSSRGFSGTWYNPATSGQGFVFEINPLTNGGFVFGGWFTYFYPPWPQWLTLQSPFSATATEADVPIYGSPGGVFDSSDYSLQSATVQAGTAHLRFTSCTTASIDYIINPNSEFFRYSGTIPLRRLTAVPADCPLQ